MKGYFDARKEAGGDPTPADSVPTPTYSVEKSRPRLTQRNRAPQNDTRDNKTNCRVEVHLAVVPQRGCEEEDEAGVDDTDVAEDVQDECAPVHRAAVAI